MKKKCTLENGSKKLKKVFTPYQAISAVYNMLNEATEHILYFLEYKKEKQLDKNG